MTQPAQSSAPAAPVPVQAPPAPTNAPLTIRTGAGSQLFTRADIAALKARKEELSNQLQSAARRRKATQEALRAASPGADKSGLEQRLGVLDARIARLEGEIDENSGQLASPGATRVSSTSATHWGPDTGNRIQDNAMPLAIVVVMFVLAPIAFATSRSIWKRGSRPAAAPGSAESSQRLERIEQAVDAIAIEVERVSENQRFVTRLMSEGKGGALAPGQGGMEPIRLGEESLINRR